MCRPEVQISDDVFEFIWPGERYALSHSCYACRPGNADGIWAAGSAADKVAPAAHSSTGIGLAGRTAWCTRGRRLVQEGAAQGNAAEHCGQGWQATSVSQLAARSSHVCVLRQRAARHTDVAMMRSMSGFPSGNC